ncbi:MAG: hypothetical protein KF819_31300 [Labilithrix sp.]|nr:hypothetical protein [Labilithrix sp.]
MTALTEEALRELLDERGVLQPGALRPPARSRCYAVFAQRPDACLDVAAIRTQADRFFQTKLGLTVDKDYGLLPPESDVARVVIAGNDGATSGTRTCFGRRVDQADVAAAEEAERRQMTSGLSLLAERCKTIWLITPESEDDRVALTIAAIFASTMLGPILTPGGAEIFGVRTARLKLEGRPSPYR